ncbi:hypothetical protein ACFS07_16685 [Undibacterium arcticum]
MLIASGWPAPFMAVSLMAVVGFGAGVAGPSRDLLIRAAAPKKRDRSRLRRGLFR